MRITKLMLQAFGPFTRRELDFGADQKSLVLICGSNEAGKSATLRAISDLRFGIPNQSTDNFVHSHADMRVGGVFVDRAGREYSVVRRKGRGATLAFAEGNDAQSAERVVPPEIEAQITSGLSKVDYESMFGLDHRRLREGGEALRNGEGEVGAALFEASAGVRSIPEVLERLDQHARTFFMPGARGKNAKINNAIKTYEEKHAEYKKFLVKPMQWAELNKKHQVALEELTRVDDRKLQLNSQLLLVQELRAVAPLLSSLDQATQVLEELKDARLLAESASMERAAAGAALAAAEHNATVATADMGQYTLVVENINLDANVLNSAAAIDRLAALAESLDTLRRESAEAALDADAETVRVKSLGEGINRSLAVENLLQAIPGGADRADIEAKLREVEHAELALNQHRESAARHASELAEQVSPTIPTPEARMALRTAQIEVSQSEATLKRLIALPAEIRAAERALGTALADLGLRDVGELQSLRPVRDSEIGAAVSESENNATRRQELEKRIAEIGAAIEAEESRREDLLADGVVATSDQVQAARHHRDTGWALVRGKYIDASNTPADAYAEGRSLPEVYEEAVQLADDLVDELARDTTRATHLQACMRDIVKLTGDQNRLRVQLEGLEAARQRHEEAWYATLGVANLPRRPPNALAEWQALVGNARAINEGLQSKIDEREQAKVIEATLASTVANAIIGTEIMAPTADASLRTLVAIAVEIESEIKQREKDINTAAGKRVEREQQEKLWIARERELIGRLTEVKERLSPFFEKLFLAEDSGTPVARARLNEFDALSAAAERVSGAAAKKKRSTELLDGLERQVRSVLAACGESETTDYRLAIERMSTRLVSARSAEKNLALAQQALEAAQERERNHADVAMKQARLLKALCVAAGVEEPGLLPAAEELSRRKRGAQAELDRCRAYLARASRRPISELRSLLLEHDAARMDAEEERHLQELEALQNGQSGVRERENTARKALEAIDSADTVAVQREEMEGAAACLRMSMVPWIRSRLAHAILTEALRRFRDRAQGPMLAAASGYFQRMTDGEFLRLLSEDVDNDLVLVAERRNGARITTEMMSEGTRDQLYLALRLAALELRRQSGVDLPLVLDDVLVTSDDGRAGLMLKTLADFSKGSQVILFTHHHHLVDVARRNVPDDILAIVRL